MAISGVVREYLERQAVIIYRASKFRNDPSHPIAQIRLLSVHQSTNAGDPLTGDLAIRELYDPSLEFHALSYVWGDEEEREPMVLNGVSTSVTKNLADALRCLRSEGKAMHLWADAVCINQYDADEKSIQISMMGEIYSGATRTTIFLGKEDERSDLAMDVVAGITEEKMAMFDPEADEWLGVYQLLRREWWTRLWVIQEAILSKQPIVKCGAKEAHLDRFADLYTYWDRLFYEHDNLDRFNSLNLFYKVPFRGFMSRDNKRWVGVGLNSWMPVVAGDFGCKYIRDRIYGILSLAGPIAKLMVDISYVKHPTTQRFVKSDRTVLKEASTVPFFELRSLTPLLMAQEHTVPELDLPSWCSDWLSSGTMTAIDYGGAAFPMDHFNEHNSIPGPWQMNDHRYKSASSTLVSRYADWRARTEPEAEDPDSMLKDSQRNYDAFLFSHDLEVMAVRGYIVDVIDFVGVTPWVDVGVTHKELQESKVERAKQVRKAVQEWEKHIETRDASIYDKTPGGRKEAFWRTLIANREFDMEDKDGDIDPRIPTPDFEQYFDAWMGRGPHADDADAFRNYSRPAIFRCTRRAFVTTEKGYFGLAPVLPAQRATTQVGDLVCILRGALMPCILRPSPGTDCCTFKGISYVHGIVGGEHLRQVKVEDLQEFWIN